MIDRGGCVFLCGKYKGEQGGSSQQLGFIDKTQTGYDVYFCNKKFIASVANQTQAKISIFNAAKNSSEWVMSANNETIDEKGKLSK